MRNFEKLKKKSFGFEKNNYVSVPIPKLDLGFGSQNVQCGFNSCSMHSAIKRPNRITLRLHSAQFDYQIFYKFNAKPMEILFCLKLEFAAK